MYLGSGREAAELARADAAVIRATAEALRGAVCLDCGGAAHRWRLRRAIRCRTCGGRRLPK